MNTGEAPDTAASAPDKPARMSHSRMNLAPFGVVVLCMFLNMLDGFDLFIIGFALPHLPSDFATSGQKGLIISFALIGMGIGAIGLARLADRYGRRSIILSGIVINFLGLIGSALAVSAETLMAFRFVTGLGVGMVSVVIVVIAQEFSPPTHRDMSTGIVMLGFPLGSTVAGLGGASVLSATGHAWQSLFWLGAGLAAVGFVIAHRHVPESREFLTKKALGPKDVVEPVNTGSLDSTRLLGQRLRARTILLTSGYGMLSAAYYFVGTWTPQLITDATSDANAGATAGIVVSVGTLLGAVGFATVSLRVPAVRITWIFLCVAVVSVAGFALLLPHLVAYAFAGALGLSVFAAMSGFTAMIPTNYPVLVRAKGYGAMLGVGRVGAILAPVIAGYALTVISPHALYAWTILPLGLAVATAVLLRVAERKHLDPGTAGHS